MKKFHVFLITTNLMLLGVNIEPIKAIENECQVLGRVMEVEGEVKELPEDGEREDLGVGDSLCLNDQVQLGENANLVVQCLVDDEVRRFLPGLTYEVTRFCPVLARCDEEECHRGETDLDSEFAVITPRKTAILNATPVFSWGEVAGASYRVRVRQLGGQVIWDREVSGTKIEYSGETPLEPGRSYRLIVETLEGGDYAEAQFYRLGEAEREIVERYQTTADPLTLVALYGKYNLNGDAIALLERLSQTTPSALVYRELGDFYARVERLKDAETAYLQSIEYGVAEGNLKGEALANARLADVYESLGQPEAQQQRLNRARQLYEQAGYFE